MSNQINKSDYDKAVGRYDAEIIDLNGKISELKLAFDGYLNYLDNSLPLLTNLEYYFKIAPLELKKKIIGSIFPEKLVFENKNYRTIKMNEVLYQITRIRTASEGLDIKTGRQKCRPVLLGTRRR